MAHPPVPASYDPHDAAARWRAAWQADDVFVVDVDDEREPYTIIMPPPNITGSLHMGHGLTYTLQDVITRYQRMNGYNALWLPGTDHAGIATQWVVRRQLEGEGIHYRDLGREAFVERVWKWREESGRRITEQLSELGVSCDWSRECFTLDPGPSRAVTEHFVRLYESGQLYRGQRLINWDPKDQTALSDLEVVHEEGVKAELWSFAYEISAEDGGGEIVVATTRPETMLGDTAVAVHPDDPRYQHLVGKSLRHPLVERSIPIVADAVLVDPEFGTGAVKVTPAHDFNDFETGKRHDLPMVNILNPDATLNDVCGAFEGLSIAEARKAVKTKIEELGLFRGSKDHTMNLGRSERSGAVVEPMLSTQWFVAMERLAKPAIETVESNETRFIPKRWENTYFAWMRDIRDWCISRQLWWGHRIPAWYCTDGHVTVARDTPKVCAECGNDALTQDDDVLDTWFSSALWPFSAMGWPNETADLKRFYPTTTLVTGFDIIPFWVARMIVAGIEFTGASPFQNIYIHALVRDAHGHKMSKTKGNVVDPLDVIGRYGADAFRFALVAHAAQGRDILWDEQRVEVYQRFQTKMWQALRFIDLNRDRFDFAGPCEPGLYDRWMALRTEEAVARVRASFDAFRFNDAATELVAFVWGEFCDWYVELSKTTLYDDDAPQSAKNAAGRTLLDTLASICQLLHPIMPFLSEEIWSHLPNTSGYVAASRYPEAVSPTAERDAVLDDVAVMQEAITEIRRVRGEMTLARSVDLTLMVGEGPLADGLSTHAAALRALANVALLVNDAPPKASATITLRGQRLFIPLEGVVDVAEELQRLAKLLDKSDKDITQLERRLSNRGFTDRAPAAVVDEVRQKLANATDRRTALRQSLAQLEAAL